ncbi:MAG: 5'/3'-nucleotidase SurE [Gammaproteobacteria bacterium CG11_big_fil_rev_8_21_14_0_20_46_22]|nr:MAG: 5'/3'-nucleotidase SurE [Gammaproteobacteria bacterium CG12_big_fil_rev_8_21_14_0_65_46_12]PIR11126.1 MAG: 5'/3'-nucleotidase SurE [Gammaproteobacteria bacterium CG11_big_fil_rev_8_21_14_0_20_46_22]
MKILLSNDDGYQAPGINQLAQTLSELGEVYVVAPDRNRSGASNSLTIDRPLSVKQYGPNAYYVSGTPTDCIHLATTGLLDIKADIVVSGINDSENLGSDVLYSGTVAAAVSARMAGIPSIAMSLLGGKEYECAARVAKQLVTRLISHPLPAGTILNVNVPNVAYEHLQGFEITRLGTREISQPATRQINPRGKEIFWIGLPGNEDDAGPGTDFSAVSAQKVSMTPLKFDLTHYEVFENLSIWLQGLV